MLVKSIASDANAVDPQLNIDVIQLKKASLIFRALHHDMRQRMIRLIHERGRIIVTDIYKNLGLEQSMASQHLAILRRVGFVLTTRAGKCIYYHVHYKRLKEVEELVLKLLS